MTEDKAYLSAVRILSAADNTEKGLIKKLIAKGYDGDAAKNAVSRLICEGFLKERPFAERTVARLYNSHYGKAYITAYLLNKDFSPDSLEYADDIMAGLDFDASAKEYFNTLIKSGKTKRQALSALYRRGFEIE